MLFFLICSKYINKSVLKTNKRLDNEKIKSSARTFFRHINGHLIQIIFQKLLIISYKFLLNTYASFLIDILFNLNKRYEKK